MKILSLVLGLTIATNAIAQSTPQQSAMQFLSNSCASSLQQIEQQMLLDVEREAENIKELREGMLKNIIGQDHAVITFTDSIGRVSALMHNPKRPLARFIFIGPTGVGKTETVLEFIRNQGGDSDKNIIRIDCGEFQEDHNISRLIGAPAGYAGYGDKPLLHPSELEAKRITIKTANGKDLSVNVILVDEIEKAGNALSKLLLGALDNGIITMGDNTSTNLRNTIIIATTNLGVPEMEALLKAKQEELKSREGELLLQEESDVTGRYNEQVREGMRTAALDGVRKRFAPEFVNRWDGIVQFYYLDHPEFRIIINKQISEIQMRNFVQAATKVGLLVSEEAKELLIQKGTDIKNGARELQRHVEKYVSTSLARLIATNQVQTGDVVMADLNADKSGLEWKVLAKGLSENQLKEFADNAYPGRDFKDVAFKEFDPNASTALTAPTLATRLNANQKALEEISLLLSTPPSKANLNSPNGPIELLINFYKIGDTIYRLEKRTEGNIYVTKEVVAMTDVLKNKYPEDKLKVYTTEEIEAILQKHSPKSE